METVLNFPIAKKVSTGDGNSALKGQALFKIIFGIMQEWELSQAELAVLVGRQPTTISEWKKKESIPTSKIPDMNDYQLIEFIQLYKLLTNLFVSINDRVSWLREENEGMGGKSPLELIKENPKNLSYVRDLLSHLANP